MPEQDLRCELQAMHSAAFGWALACCSRRREEAEDVLQASYLKMLDGRARFGGRSSLQTFLFGVIRKTASERRRSAVLRGTAFTRWLGGLPEPAPAMDPADEAIDGQLRKRLLEALAELPARQRDLLHLVFYQELTLEEAAGVLGIRQGTASTHYKRGKARLRALLGEDARPWTQRMTTTI